MNLWELTHGEAPASSAGNVKQSLLKRGIEESDHLAAGKRAVSRPSRWKRDAGREAKPCRAPGLPQPRRSPKICPQSHPSSGWWRGCHGDSPRIKQSRDIWWGLKPRESGEESQEVPREPLAPALRLLLPHPSRPSAVPIPGGIPGGIPGCPAGQDEALPSLWDAAHPVLRFRVKAGPCFSFSLPQQECKSGKELLENPR